MTNKSVHDKETEIWKHAHSCIYVLFFIYMCVCVCVRVCVCVCVCVVKQNSTNYFILQPQLISIFHILYFIYLKTFLNINIKVVKDF